MKKLILLSFLCSSFLAYTAKAQDATEKPEKPKNYIAISAGLSAPFGDFKKADYGTLGNENNKAGYAKKGLMYSLEMGRYLSQHWGYAIQLGFQDQGRLNTNDVTNISDGYRIGSNAYTTTVTASKRYNYLTALVGPQYTYSFGKFIVDARVVAGALKSTSSPALAVYIYDYDSKIISTFTQYHSKSFAFAYGASASFTYKLSDGFGFVLRESLLDTPTGLTVKNDPHTGRYVTHTPISVYQTSLGIRLTL